MRDYVSIGSAPCDEDCVQVTKEGDYHEAMKTECRRFLELIRKKLGPEPPGTRLAVKANPHDFGTYYDVICYFNDNDDEGRHYAFRCEAQSPRTWGDDKLTPEEETTEKARNEAREGICRVCGEEFEEQESLAKHILVEHVLHRGGEGPIFAS